MVVTTRSEAQTLTLGRRLGRLLRGYDVVCLDGELGSGKTTLTRGLAQGAGSRNRVASPTFALARVYRGSRWLIYHVDLYRVSPDQTRDIGLEEFTSDPRGICVVEWPRAGEAYYPEDRLEVRLAHLRGGRRLRFVGRGPRSRRIVRRLGLN
ncbi:MAG: tRNA (adenosine(37)-N6)-threonylcarbamoyltransferase complex ATPase subunit type 1 TsaE [Elusimicrobia bacterium]|nr:tRNA (adenosine(37)-N6)-threonylcarbamoyltransferase complex ATPase subunit type 1 TsaE [Elusimicrobiota bacterium]